MSSPQKRRAAEKNPRKPRRKRTLLILAIILIVVAVLGVYIYEASQLPPVVYARLDTSMGLIEAELYHNATPQTVTNFVNLARSGFFHQLVWHRIVNGTLIQTGDPNSRNGYNNSTWGYGGSSQKIPLEIDNSLHNYRGYLGMALFGSDPNSGSSQFYINLKDNSATFDGKYAVFGKVIIGISVADAIGRVPVYPRDSQPITPVFLSSVTISYNP